jgi:hypothetical protein
VQQRSPAVETRAVSEIAQVAGEAGFIFGVSGVMAAITLVVSYGKGQRMPLWGRRGWGASALCLERATRLRRLRRAARPTDQSFLSQQEGMLVSPIP